MTDTTTQLLILHERELKRRPRTGWQNQLVDLLAVAASTSASRDSFDKLPSNMPTKQPVIRINKFVGTVRFPRKPVRPAYYFNLMAANGEIVGQSDAYTSKAARDKTVALLTKAKFVT